MLKIILWSLSLFILIITFIICQSQDLFILILPIDSKLQPLKLYLLLLGLQNIWAISYPKKFELEFSLTQINIQQNYHCLYHKYGMSGLQ